MVIAAPNATYTQTTEADTKSLDLALDLSGAEPPGLLG